MDKKQKFKGQIGFSPAAILVGLAVMVLIVVVIVAFGFVFLANVQTQISALNSTTVNTDAAGAAVSTGSTALGSIPGWLPLVILAFILLVILGLVAIVAMVAGGMGAQQ